MNSDVVELRPHFPPGIKGDVDTSLPHTLECSVKLGYKLGSMALHRLTGRSFPFANSGAEAHYPRRHVDLVNDQRFSFETTAGSEHVVDLYGAEYLFDSPENLAPLVLLMPLTVAHDSGFQAPVIDVVQQHARAQGRATIVISSEGFGEKGMSRKEAKKLSFEKMSDNVHETLDILEAELGIKISRIITAGGSRGATVSMLAAADETKGRRVEGVVAVAPAGLRELDFRKRALVIKQFVVNEPLHMLRKASNLEGQDLIDYLRTMFESLQPPKRWAAIGQTALLFLKEAPLNGIGVRLNDGTDRPVWAQVMDSDGVTMPKHWERELAELPGGYVTALPGFHLSIDSTRFVAAMITQQLDVNRAALAA